MAKSESRRPARRTAPRPVVPLGETAARSFFRVVSTDEARSALAEVAPTTKAESVPTAEACGRVLARPLRAREDMPHFDRANMDGYAVRARDTFGASASTPAYLSLVGAIEMGANVRVRVDAQQAMRISTGGMMPPGADAVVMVEYTDELDGQVTTGSSVGRTVEIQRSVAPGENVLRIGEDIARGTVVFPPGRRLRARDLGALVGLGIRTVSVHRRPRIALLSTGDEIVSPETRPRPGQVRNINAYSLAAMIPEHGGEVCDFGVVPDDPARLRAAMAEALKSCDAIVLSGGSSVGTKDITLEVIRQFHPSRVLFHGISVAPGKPTILAQALGKPILGLPGHPQSALLIFEIFGAPWIRMMEGESPTVAFGPKRTVPARLGGNIASKPGREDYIRVRLRGTEADRIAEPMPAKSGAVFNLVQADGLIRIDASSEGLESGTAVDVILL